MGFKNVIGNIVLLSLTSEWTNTFIFNTTNVYTNILKTFTAASIQHTIKHPVSQIVWGCISDQGVGGLYFVQGTVNTQVYIGNLEEELFPTIQDHFTSVQNVFFQDDSAPCHTAKLVSNNLKSFILPLDLN